MTTLAERADAVEAPPAPPGAAQATPDTPASPAGVAASEQAGPSPNFKAIAFMLTGLRMLSCQILKVESPKVTLCDANIQEAAAALAPVADHYGYQIGGMVEGPWAPAMFVAGPILWEAVDQLNMELKARRAKTVQEEPAQPGQAGADQPAGHV